MKFGLFSRDLGIDLGTSNTLIFEAGKGIVVREPSVVAMDKNTGNILQIGSAARNMLGRTPGNVVAMKPLKGGVISDHEMTVKMLQELLRKVSTNALFTPKPRVVICVPCDVTEVEERTLINAAMDAGVRRVYLIQEPMAAALGAGIDISGPRGQMVVDIGGGTSDVAVLSMGAVAVSSSTKIAGDDMDADIIQRIRQKYGVVIGQVTAENIKIQIGCVYPRPENIEIVVKGRDAKTGLPRNLAITSQEIMEILLPSALRICDEVLSVLEQTSPELVGDIAENGITLTGGASQIWGMDKLLSERTGIACTVADDADCCVAYGCGKSLNFINHMTEGVSNIARKRALQG